MGPSLEIVIEFLSSASDRIDVESGDQGEENVAAVSDLLGLQSSEPASLLFIEATHQEIDVVMMLAGVGVVAGKTSRALALMNRNLGHRSSSEYSPHDYHR